MDRSRSRVAWAVVMGMAAVGVGVLGCGGAGEGGGGGGGGEGGGVAAAGAWVRVAIVPEGAGAPDAAPVNSAAYLTVRNPGLADDAIVAVETDVAGAVELHSVSMEDGVMRMRQVESVPVPAGGEAVLEPGGYHVMLIGVTRPLEEGDTVPLTVRLESGATLTLSAPVRRAPPE